MNIAANPADMSNDELLSSLSAIDSYGAARTAKFADARFNTRFPNNDLPALTPQYLELRSKIEDEIAKRGLV